MTASSLTRTQQLRTLVCRASVVLHAVKVRIRRARSAVTTLAAPAQGTYGVHPSHKNFAGKATLTNVTTACRLTRAPHLPRPPFPRTSKSMPSFPQPKTAQVQILQGETALLNTWLYSGAAKRTSAT
jgi:hypothetical protein